MTGRRDISPGILARFGSDHHCWTYEREALGEGLIKGKTTVDRSILRPANTYRNLYARLQGRNCYLDAGTAVGIPRQFERTSEAHMMNDAFASAQSRSRSYLLEGPIICISDTGMY